MEQEKSQHSTPSQAAILKSKLQKLRDTIPDELGLRIHRSISWLNQAQEFQQNNKDAAFIFFWIAFNASYTAQTKLIEKELQSDFFVKVVNLDTKHRMYNTFWNNFSGPVRLIMKNRYIFQPFWDSVHEQSPTQECSSDAAFERQNRIFLKAFQNKDTAAVLGFIFSRLYTLRNQIIHGGATYNSRVNRKQLNDGVAILASMLPLFIDIMLDNPTQDWGSTVYPPLDASHSKRK